MHAVLITMTRDRELRNKLATIHDPLQELDSIPSGNALFLLRVRHAAAGLVLLLDAALVAGEQRLAVLGLLVLLRNVAAAAAARRGEVDEAAALEVVLGAQVGALQGREADVARHAARGAEEEALKCGTVLAKVRSASN